MRLASSVATLAGLALGIGFHAQAAEQHSDAATASEQTASVENHSMVGIDPKTGKLRPLSDAEIQALSAKAATMKSVNSGTGFATPASVTNRPARRNSDGSLSKRVPMSSMSAITAVKNPDGTISISESTDQPVSLKQEVSE